MLLYLAAIQEPEDREKFRVLYTNYRGLMFHVARRILGNDQDAEDAVHNAFEKIIEQIEKISHPDSPKNQGFRRYHC